MAKETCKQKTIEQVAAESLVAAGWKCQAPKVGDLVMWMDAQGCYCSGSVLEQSEAGWVSVPCSSGEVRRLSTRDTMPDRTSSGSAHQPVHFSHLGYPDPVVDHNSGLATITPPRVEMDRKWLEDASPCKCRSVCGANCLNRQLQIAFVS